MRLLQFRYFPLAAAAIGLAMCLPWIGTGWSSDDFVHRAVIQGLDELPVIKRSPAKLFAFLDGSPTTNRTLMEIGILPWWTYERVRGALLRPLTGYSHWLDYQLWPTSPAMMHLHSLAWFSATVALAAVFYRRLIQPSWIAGLAALLFAIDDAHALPAGWIANRNATIAMCFGLLTLIVHDCRRRDHWKPGAFLAPLFFLCSLLGNEGGVATAGYLFAYALFLDRGRLSMRVFSLVPYVVVGIVWLLTYHVLGFGAEGSDMYVDPVRTPVRFLLAIWQRGPLLLWGQWMFPPSDLSLLLSPAAGRVFQVIALAFAVMLGFLLWPLVRRDAIARFWSMGMMLALIPSCGAFASDRLLFFAGLGGMGLLAQLLGSWGIKAPWIRADRLPRYGRRTIAVLFCLVHLVVAPIGLITGAAKFKGVGDIIDRSAASLPHGPGIEHKQVVIAATPTAFFTIFGPIYQALHGSPIPSGQITLGSGIHPIDLYRPDVRTLIVRPHGGFLLPGGATLASSRESQPWISLGYAMPLFDRLLRSDDQPMVVGERVSVGGTLVTVTQLTEAGRPAEARFEFDKPLEDSAYVWVTWSDGLYVPFTPPQVGQTMTLPAPEFSLGKWSQRAALN